MKKEKFYEVRQRIHAKEINPVSRRYDYQERVYVVSEKHLRLAKSFFEHDSVNKGLDFFEAAEISQHSAQAPEPAAEHVALEILPEIDLASVRAKDYDARIDRDGEDSSTCFICGRKTAQELFVHYTTGGKLTSAVSHPDSQGLFPVGPECAKKLPVNYIFN
jgi:hypothetical protein